MAPTETSILRSYLLAPSSLPCIISLAEFTALFPKARQKSRQIRTLYRDLQGRRDHTTAAVAEDIDAETKRSLALRRAVARARREAEAQGPDVEMDIERAILPDTDLPVLRRGDLHAVLEDLDGTADELQAEVAQLRRDEAELLASVRQTVGGLSDLRYGRLANGKLRKQVHDGLEALEEACRGT